MLAMSCCDSCICSSAMGVRCHRWLDCWLGCWLNCWFWFESICIRVDILLVVIKGRNSFAQEVAFVWRRASPHVRLSISHSEGSQVDCNARNELGNLLIIDVKAIR